MTALYTYFEVCMLMASWMALQRFQELKAKVDLVKDGCGRYQGPVEGIELSMQGPIERMILLLRHLLTCFDLDVR